MTALNTPLLKTFKVLEKREKEKVLIYPLVKSKSFSVKVTQDADVY